MEASVVPARRTCELRGHREPHVDDDSFVLECAETLASVLPQETSQTPPC